MSYLFKCPRCKRRHSVPYKEDLKDYICTADTFVQANKPKQQNVEQKYSALANEDGTERTWWNQNKLSTLRDVHLDVPVINVKVLPENGRHTGLKSGAYHY